MKKIHKITTAIFLPFVMLFSSCFDPIFYEIRKDVKPETATVSGNIPQITRFTMGGEEYLFLSADKGLRYKRVDNEKHGSWQVAKLPFNLVHFNFDNTDMDGKQLIGVYADSEYLYLHAAPYITTGSEGTSIPWDLELWASKDPLEGKWEKVTAEFPIGYDSSTGKYVSLFHLFQTNAPKKEHRHVYIYNDVKENYYELNGTTLSEPISASDIDIQDDGSVAYSAAYFDGGVKFFSSTAVITDEKYDDKDDTTTEDAKNLYYAQGPDLYYYTSDGYKKACSARTTISSLAVTKDSIIIGLGNIMSKSSDTGGITRVKINENGIPEDSTSGFSTNAELQISSAYTVLALLNATPENPELESALYASITFSGLNGLPANIGLWSYYQGRGNWNRE